MSNFFPRLLQHVPGITLIAVVAMFFAPFLRVVEPGDAERELLIIGMGLFGGQLNFEGLDFAVNLQLILLSILALSSFFVLLSKGRVKLFFLCTSIFLITIFPIWIMAFSEGFIRPHFEQPINFQYSIAWFPLAIALLGTTYSILNLRKEDYLSPVTRNRDILDL